MQARGRCSSRGDGQMNDAKRTAHRDTVTLTDNSTGKSLELPVLSGSVGPRAIDVSRLYADTGCFTYDPGFTSTASCDSDITYLDRKRLVYANGVDVPGNHGGRR